MELFGTFFQQVGPDHLIKFKLEFLDRILRFLVLCYGSFLGKNTVLSHLSY